MTDLPDVNVWVALSLKQHSLHAPAYDYWDKYASETISFCRTTALGFVRVSAQIDPVESKSQALSNSWNSYRNLLTDRGIAFVEEAIGLESCLNAWIRAGLVTGKTLTDAYLAAFCVSSAMRLVTFDRGLKVFPGVNLLLLEP